MLLQRLLECSIVTAYGLQGFSLLPTHISTPANRNLNSIPSNSSSINCIWHSSAVLPELGHLRCLLLDILQLLLQTCHLTFEGLDQVACAVYRQIMHAAYVNHTGSQYIPCRELSAQSQTTTILTSGLLVLQ